MIKHPFPTSTCKDDVMAVSNMQHSQSNRSRRAYSQNPSIHLIPIVKSPPHQPITFHQHPLHLSQTISNQHNQQPPTSKNIHSIPIHFSYIHNSTNRTQHPSQHQLTLHKLESFSEKYQIITKEITYLNQQLDLVNSEEEWVELKRRHSEVLQRMEEVSAQLQQIINDYQHHPMQQPHHQQPHHQQPHHQQHQSIHQQYQQLIKNYHQLQQQYNLTKHKNQSMGQLSNSYGQLKQPYQQLPKQQQSQVKDHPHNNQNSQVEKYIMDLQMHAKKLQQSNYKLQTQIQNKSDNPEYQKLIEIIKQKQSQLNQLKNQTKLIQSKYEQQILLKNQEVNQLTKYIKKQQIDHKNKLQEQIYQLEMEIKNSVVNLENRIKQLEDEIWKKIQEKQQIKNQYQYQINSLNRQLDRKNNQSQQIFKELQEKITMLEDQIRKKSTEKDSNMKLLNNRIVELEDQLTRKNLQIIRPLSDRNIKLQQQITKKSIQLSRYKQGNQYLRRQAQLRSLIENQQKKEQQIMRIKREKDRLLQQNQQLQRQYENVINELNKKKMQLNLMKRHINQVNSYDQQIKNLNNILQKKNQEVFELKAYSIQSENMRAELNNSIVRIQRLNATVQNKNKQISGLKQKIFGLEQKIREISMPAITSVEVKNSPKQLISQIQYLKQILGKKDQQMLRIRQSLQLKDTQIQELQLQTDKVKNKLNYVQKYIEQQKQQWKKRIGYLQSESIRKSQYFQQQLTKKKISYEEQVNMLKDQLKSKNSLLYQYQNSEKESKQKQDNIERQKNKLSFQLQHSFNKLKQMEAIQKQLFEKIQVLKSQIQIKQNKIEYLNKNRNEDELKNTRNRINQLDLTLKIKQNDIKLKQTQFNDLSQKLKNRQIEIEHQVSKYREKIQKKQNQILLLNKKIEMYQGKIGYQSQFYNQNKLRNFSSNKIFQQAIIYKLKQQNQRLIDELKRRTVSQHKIAGNNYYLGKNKKQKNINTKFYVNQGEVNYIQKRLNDFNKKLQDLIDQNRHIEITPNRNLILNNQQQLQKIINQCESQKQALIHRHSNEISLFKIRIQQLKRYCEILESKIKNQKRSSYSLIFDKKYNLQQQNVYLQQLNFYKEKNKELQERVDRHINVNNQLKQKLQLLIKNGSNNSSLIYFKDQAQSLQSIIKNLNLTIKKLTDENKYLRSEVGGKNRQNIQNYDYKILQYQNKIQEHIRKYMQINAEKNMLQNQKTQLLKDTNSLNQQIYQLKKCNIQHQFEGSYVSQSKIKKFQDKILQFMNQNQKLDDKNKKLQQINQNLNRDLLRRERDYFIQNEKKINTIVQLQKQISVCQYQLKQKQQQLAYLNIQIQNHIKKYQIEIIQMSKLIADKQTELQKQNSNQSNTELNNLKNTIKQLQQKIQSFQRQHSLKDFSNSQNEIYNLREIINRQQQQNQLFINELNRLNNQNSYINQQILSIKKILSSIRYSFELLRSNYLQIDGIFGQIELKSTSEKNVGQRIRLNIQRGLKECKQINLLINRV